jgi:hypothetical protein
LYRVFKPQKDAATIPLRAPEMISRSFSRAEADRSVSPHQKIAIGTPALPHPAANRLVQSTFLIGFAMRKVLSIFSFPILGGGQPRDLG